MAQPNASKIPIGTILADKYRVTREIGRGGMASVYEAQNVDIGKRVAVKILAAELTASTIVVERFLREARAAAAISSPYICDVYDSGKLDDGRPFLVLELLEGESLYERMTRVRQIDGQTTLRIVTHVSRGLTKAHAANIVHRDLKPENVFLTSDEDGSLLCKILDFGLAKFYAPVDEDGDQARLTREGAVFGTPAYMSPEQVKGQGQVDSRADLWALGCITYECLTGRTVWATEQGVAMTFAQIASSPLPDALALRPDLPPSFQAWFLKALARSANDRFQTARELADELANALGDPNRGGLSLTSLPDLISSPGMQHQGSSGDFAPVSSRQSPPSSSRTGAAAVGLAIAPTERPPTSGPGNLSPVPEMPSSEGGTSATLGRGEGAPNAHRRNPARAALTLAGVALVVGGGYAGWLGLRHPVVLPPATPLPPASSRAPTAAATGPSNVLAGEAPKGPKWAPLIASAQAQIADGSFPDAVKSLKEAVEMGSGTGKVLLEQAQVAAAAKGPCQVTGLARPRPYQLASPAGRPVIAFTPHGAIASWTDDHESAGHDHVYTAFLDTAMKSVGVPRDVTPEGTLVSHADLLAVGDRVALVYSDIKGAEAGVHARWLDADGRIAGPASATSSKRQQSAWPTIDRAPDGSFWVAWDDERQPESSDLYLRHLNPALEPIGPEIKASDYVKRAPKAHVRSPSIGIAGAYLQVVYRFERDPLKVIDRMRIALNDAQLGKGLDNSQASLQKDRELGEVKLVNTDKLRAEWPEMACSTEGCYLVWNAEGGGGAFAAYMDAAQGQILWRKKFDPKGAHPTVAVSPSGGAEVAWYQGGRIFIAAMARDGIGLPTPLLHVNGDPPRPSLSAGGAPGEWYLAWLDSESGHPEAYTARALCK